jgi:hypothetical protein
MKIKKLQKPALNELEFVPVDEIPDEIVDAQASLMLNPYVRWAKFIFTDDQPNGNNERTPLEEFDNLIQSGIHMPIKMAEGRIEEGHENASPIGVITHLKKEVVEMAGKVVNQIVGLAAFWLRERPSDISYIKERIDNGQEVNLSWELGAQDKTLSGDGVFDWRGLAVQAVAVVDRPAYLGRTRIVAMAAKKGAKSEEQETKREAKWSTEYVNRLPDSHFLYIERDGNKDSEGRTSPEKRFFPVKDDKGLYDKSKLEEALTEAGKSNLPTPIFKSLKKTVTTLLEKLDAGASLEELSKVEIAPLENKFTEEDTVELEQLKQRVQELETKLAAAEASLQEKEEVRASLETEKTEMETKLVELQAFKDEIDAEVAKAEKLDGIKAKFAEAKLEKDEAYFTENEAKLLGLDDASLDFMIQEFSAFSATASRKEDNEETNTKIPNFTNADGEIDTHAIVEALRQRKNSK